MLYSSFSEAKSNPSIYAKYISIWQLPSPYKNPDEERFLDNCVEKITDAAEAFDFIGVINVGATCYKLASTKEQKEYILDVEKICIKILMMIGVPAPNPNDI
ncbi:hypothetical protein F7734_53385 [Scytonema sp. UIC 10036]|uniref:hypothetical protein n=1 Tax=Scytonema sp. UIC 10036 TaxID=2304196 RepID=UPI0012DA2A58|nr:hypothetical protein [Scytonema sp. UIC 10036]MUH00603.1 hypothetical protein [Scytonema sp. UIC 10036]